MRWYFIGSFVGMRRSFVEALKETHSVTCPLEDQKSNTDHQYDKTGSYDRNTVGLTGQWV